MGEKEHKLEVLKQLADRRREGRRRAEERIRRLVQEEMAHVTAAVDIAAREAFEAGATISDLRRATGNKDWATARAMLDRTAYLSKDAQDKFSRTEGGRLFIRDGEFTAEFEVKEWDDGTLFFTSETDTYVGENYNVRNPIVVELDGAIDGDLYDEAVAFWRGTGK